MDYTLSEHARKVIDERSIAVEWIDRCLSAPVRIEPDPADAALTHHLLPIVENDGRVLRVVYNHSAKPVHGVTAFFDRRLRGQL